MSKVLKTNKNESIVKMIEELTQNLDYHVEYAQNQKHDVDYPLTFESIHD